MSKGFKEYSERDFKKGLESLKSFCESRKTPESIELTEELIEFYGGHLLKEMEKRNVVSTCEMLIYSSLLSVKKSLEDDNPHEVMDALRQLDVRLYGSNGFDPREEAYV